MDSWENKSSEFLFSAPNNDAEFIAGYLFSNPVSTILELGFGTNRLLPYILKAAPDIRYFGFDKTKKFVRLANKKYKNNNLSFDILDIENIKQLISTINKINPDLLILRSVLEHISSWKNVLRTINSLHVPILLITTYTGSLKESISGLRRGDYIVNILSDNEVFNILTSYTCSSITSFNSINRRFYIYKKD